MIEFHLDWFNWTLKGGEKPEFLEDRVAYYMMNQNKWIYANQFDQLSNGSITYYLSGSDSDSKLLIDPGKLSTQKAATSDIDQIIYDPLDTADVPSYDGSDYYTAPLPIKEKGSVIYVSEELENITTVAGRFEAGLYLSMDVPDTDMQVSL